MKTKNRILFLFALLFCSLSYVSFAQTEHLVTLNVNTGEIVKPDIAPYCNFGQASDITNEDFTIYVKDGDTIRWVGVSTSSEDDRVEIHSINYQGGKNVLGENVLNGVDGVVTGTVTNAQAGDEEKYVVYFKVFNNGTQRNGMFQIDPKVKIVE